MENTTLKTVPAEFKYLDSMSDLMDSRFRLPGTNVRFGLDFLIGLVPFAGDAVTFGFSGLLVIAMVRNGASGMVVVKMLGNVLLDSLVGSIPLLGDLFDLGFKSNRLLKEHYESGKHGGSAIPVILAVMFALLLMAFLIMFIAVKMGGWIFDKIQSF